VVVATKAQTRPSGKKTATCGGLRRTSGRLPNPGHFGRTTKCHAGKPAKPAAHGRREILPSVIAGDGVIPRRNRVPVVDAAGRPLMPCLSVRARKLLDNGKAVGAWNKLGIFYIRLKAEKTPKNQPLVVGIDPGSKFEGYSVVGTKDTVVNIMSEAPDWVKKAVETRRTMRRARRFRNTRWRECRFDNRLAGKAWLPPSTKSRWDAKLRVATKLKEILPLTGAVVEDVKAVTKKGKRRWNVSFSPIEAGKEYLYNGLKKIGLELSLKQGMETKEARDALGLKKIKSKSRPVFASHCVDAWVLAASETGATEPTTRGLLYAVPLHFNRRQLHMLQPTKGGLRRPQGGTLSLGFKRGTRVQHPKYGLCYIGGCAPMENRLSLHSMKTGKRLCQNARTEDIEVLSNSNWRSQFLPALKSGASLRRER